ncbi:MAG TPA: PilX N-terminal domain-containing pilus assembly protein [Myxococcota bacterium]|nr:PilX N-terminal domain-containing pilus assembly protein [Myxococcota bacterium]
MTHTKNQRLTRALRDESGMALLISVIVLLLMSALALSALQRAGDEAIGSGGSRRKDASLYAAESGLAKIKVGLFDLYLSGFTSVDATRLQFYDPAMVTDAYGNPIEVSTGKPENGGLPATPAKVEPAAGATPKTRKGNDLRIGGHNSTNGKAMAYPADVTTRDAANSIGHIQIQYSVSEGGGY